MDQVSIPVRDHDGIAVRIQFVLQVLPAGVEHPVHAIGHAGGEIEVLQHGEIRQADLEVVPHTVREAVQRLHAQGITELLDPDAGNRIHLIGAVGIVHEVLHVPHLEIEAVLEGGRITEGNLLVGFLLAHAVLLLERIETRHGEGNVRQGEGVAGVTGILVVQGVQRQAYLAVPVA